MNSISIPDRTCTRCHIEYPATLEHFKAHPNGKYGLSSWCISCHDEYQVEYRTKNRERRRSYNKNYDATHKDQRRQYYDANKAHITAYHHQYYIDNKDRHRELHKQWCQRNPDYRRQKYHERPEYFRAKARQSRRKHHAKILIRNRVYKNRKRSADGSYDAQDIGLILKSQKNLCWWCGCELEKVYHIDHRVPLSRGGSNNLDNLCATCPTCNLSKNDKLPHEWNGRLL